ncbi:MAG: D-aminoacyl-tRNA deacylase [Clostridia bacterium]|nr:dtd D-tyrosyl-tRNA(Tyr) deacylase [Clostridiales bacterium]MDK2986591.1 D-aminoacyl-tRNA deacylase [Clostridia bacterium]
MRAVVQRVTSGKVAVQGKTVGSIGTGLVVLLGVAPGDEEKDLKYIMDKVVNLRIFEDEDGKMNLSIKDISGEILVISQFTLYGDCRKGRRPSFSNAAAPEKANELYLKFISDLRDEHNLKVETGVFGEFMDVSIVNSGPVTMLLDSSKLF